MKQSKHAITFLMAQYRSIFKQAYFKGLISAIVLTAGLGMTGYAQADSVRAFQIFNGTNWTSCNDSNAADIATATKIAGDVSGSGGEVSGGSLVIGAIASGGQLDDASGAVYGGFSETADAVNASATQNKLTIQDGGTVSSGVGNGNMVGGWAKATGTGTAYSEGNQLIITEGANISGAGQAIGAWASSLNGATASGNSVSITGGAAAADVLTLGNGAFGGMVWADAGATSGDYKAIGNSVTLTNVKTANTDESKNIVGGYLILTYGGTTSGDSLVAQDNTVNLTKVIVGEETAGTDPFNGTIVGNFASYNGGTAEQVSAIASGTESLNISNSTIYHSVIAGGYAENAGSNAATADGNSVTISNTQLLTSSDSSVPEKQLGNTIYGGHALSVVETTGETVSVSASNNSIAITGTSNVVGQIFGGNVTVASGSNVNDFTGSTLTANGNSVTIEIDAGEDDENKLDVKSILGALVDADASGAEIQANNNSVTVNADVVNTTPEDDNSVQAPNIVAAFSTFAATMNNNSLTFNGSFSGGQLIAAYAGAGVAGGKNMLSGNSVTIGADAVVDGAQIWAAYSEGFDALATNNTVTVQGKVSNSEIFGGAGSGSLVSVTQEAYLIYDDSVSAANYRILSDEINLAGKVEIGANDTLKLAGFFVNGNTQSGSYNTNQTTIGSTAEIYNAGNLVLLGDTTIESGAKLHATQDNANITVNGDESLVKDTVDVDGVDVDVTLIGGRGSLTLSAAAFSGYLNAGDDYKLPDAAESAKPSQDESGSFTVTSGGVVKFTDAVVLSDFKFNSGGATPVAGQITVDANTTYGGSIFKGTSITVAKALSDGTATPFSAQGVLVEADSLTLGSSSLTADATAAIILAKSTGKNEINFNSSENFVLQHEVVGNNYTKTNFTDPDETNYYSAQNGTINGEVNISGSSATELGKIHIANGNWVANDQITVSASGNLTVGAADDIESPIDTDITNRPDATLTLKDGLVLNASTAVGNSATIVVSGSQTNLYDFDDAALTPGDDRLVILDATSGLTMEGDSSDQIQGKVEVDVTSGAIFKVAGDDLSEILAQNDTVAEVNRENTGAFFDITKGGVLEVSGELNADFDDFNSTADTNNGIKLEAGAGYLKADTLIVTNPNAGTAPDDSSYNGPHLNFTGNVIAKNLTISDLQATTGDSKPESANNYASKVYVDSGNIEVSQSFTSQNDTLVLGLSDGTASAAMSFTTDAVEDSGSITINNLQLDSGSVKVLNGTWTAENTVFNLSGASTTMGVGGDTDKDINDQDTEAVLNAHGLTMNTDTDFTVAVDGTATFDTLDTSKLVATTDDGAISIYGTLVINGYDSTAANDDAADGAGEPEAGGAGADPYNGVHFGSDGSIQIENNGVLKFGTLATTGAILADGNYSGSTITLKDNFSKIANNGGELHLGFTTGTSFDGDAIKALKDALFTADSFADGVLINGGLLNIGFADFDGYELEELSGDGLSGYTIDWADLKDFSDVYSNDVTNNKLVQTNVANVGSSDGVMGHYGSFSMDSSASNSSQVTITGNTSLRFAEGNNGYFISNATHDTALGAVVGAQKTFELIDGGKIGKITLNDGDDNDDKNITKVVVRGNGQTYIKAVDGHGSNTKATLFDVQSDTYVSEDITDIAQVQVAKGVKLEARSGDFTELAVNGGLVKFASKLENNFTYLFGGEVDAAQVTFHAQSGSEFEVINNGLYKAEHFTVKGSSIASGKLAQDVVLNIGLDLTEQEANSWLPGEKLSGTGRFEAEILELNGAALYVDPNYDEATSIASIGYFKDGNQTYGYNSVGELNGKVWIGKNSVVGVGANQAETLAAISSYQQNGALQADKYGSILYLNGQLTLQDNANTEISLNASADRQQNNVRNSLKYVESGVTQYADLGLGANTAILMTEQAFEDENGDKTGTAITFRSDDAVVNGQGGDIILAGSFDASEALNIFDDASGDGVNVLGAIEVRTQNGFLFTTLTGEDAGKNVQLHVDKERAYSIMTGASDPVLESLISYHDDRVTPLEGTGQPLVKGESNFLNEVVNSTNGAPAEAVARMAVYGGTAQAALGAGATSYDAISGRLGMGAQTSAISYADNSQGAGIWVTPIYKSHDSDGFAAQGLSYGVDMSLYGLALGGDFTLANGMRFGGMFNVGSGSADGQGNEAAANTSNDFSYWGLAVYGVYTWDQLSVVADVGYTVVDNDLEATTSLQDYSKLTGTVDSQALTVGVTAQYKLQSDSVDAVPHIGLRYTNVDVDDFTVQSSGDIAQYRGDSMGVFSIPVGVTISKEIVAGAWTIKPSFDLTLTANFGDDSINNSVDWTGVENLKTNLESEVLDSFTYGASFGVAAKSGNLSFGVGLNYTGASSADEYGIQGNVRFVF